MGSQWSSGRERTEMQILLENASATGLFNFLFGRSTEELSLDDNRELGQMTFTEDFEEPVLTDVQDGRLTFNWRALFLWEEGHELIQIDDGAVELISFQMVRSHTHFAEIARVVFVEIDSVMMLTTSIAATSGMLAVFSDSSMAVAHMSTQLSCLLRLFFRHFEFLNNRKLLSPQILNKLKLLNYKLPPC